MRFLGHTAVVVLALCASVQAQPSPLLNVVGEPANEVVSVYGEPLEVKARPSRYGDIELWTYGRGAGDSVVVALRDGSAVSETMVYSFDNVEAAIHRVATLTSSLALDGTTMALELDGIQVERTDESLLYRAFGKEGRAIQAQMDVRVVGDGSAYEVRLTLFGSLR